MPEFPDRRSVSDEREYVDQIESVNLKSTWKAVCLLTLTLFRGWRVDG
jgi:hypothetical protein